MEVLIWKLLRALRPRIGWLQFTLALCAIWCAAVAAASSPLELPSNRFSWTGLAGLLLGLWLGRPRMGAGQPAAWPRALRALWVGLLVAALLAIGAALVASAASTLPPAGLASQDLAALRGWLAAWWRGQASWTDLPASRAWQYLAAALGRFWADLLAAPNAGERGARLIVLSGGIASTWLGALALGWGLARERNLFGWALPALAAVAFTGVVGGGDLAGLLFALALLLLLTIANSARRRERAWQRSGADYSDEISTDTLAWGSGAVLLVLVLALALPTTLSNPLADLFWRDVELPSGIAALDRNLPRPSQRDSAPVGISTLPELALGVSLAQGPPSEPALRVHLGAPLPAGPWPRYWRARVFNFYNGRYWTTNARVGAFEATTINAAALPGGVLQEIDDLRQQREILIALPDVFAVEQGTPRAERLADGSLAALTSASAPTRYRVLSRPQEQALPPRLDAAPPDLSSYLGLPANYERVSSLAQVIAGGRISRYDQALAIEQYLRALSYSYEVKPVPGGGDAVEQFLFDMRQGYCTYYASAMAMLARSLGIPARLAIGYATGEYDQATGAYLVREADAHAWPELYIDGRWLPFEPTPIRPLPARNLAEPEPAPAPEPAPETQARGSGPLIWAAVLAGVLALSGLGWWLARPRRAPPLVAEIQARIERAGARAGIAWPAGATLQEYGGLLAAGAPASAADLRLAIALIEQARYSGQPLRADQEGRLRGAAERALTQLARARARERAAPAAQPN